MHVKLETCCDLDEVTDFDINLSDLKYVEKDLREELFGNSNYASDLSESSQSDEDKMLSIEQALLGDFSSGLGSCSATSSRSSSASFDRMNCMDSMSLTMGLSQFCDDDDEEGSPETVMVDPLNLELKQERYSPEHYNPLINRETVDQLWNFLTDEDVKPSIKIPESPPWTPPNGSPPLSPTSITSHEGLPSSVIPTTAVITLTQIDDKPNVHRKNPSSSLVAPKMPSNVISMSREVERKTVSRNIQIQPRMNSILKQKPMIKMENGTPTVSLVPLAHQVTKPVMMATSQHSNFVSGSAFNIPDSLSQTCTVVSEKKPLLPSIAPSRTSLKISGVAGHQAMKRQERMIKNRESASLSRKRKKEYLTSLEDKVKELDYENNLLKEENQKLRKRLSSSESERSIFKGVKFPLKRTSSVAFLGITFLFLLNLDPILDQMKTSRGKTLIPDPLSNLGGEPNSPLTADAQLSLQKSFTQRSLLWFTPSSDQSSSSNFSTSCPLFINATESIRIENELRDWFETRLESNNVASSRPTETKAKKSSSGRKARRKVVEDRALTASPKKNLPPSSHHDQPQQQTDVYRYLYHPDKFTTKESQGLMAGVESFLRSFERRNDTYYVVALSSDHILLPASAHNTSTRPKMSLLVPTSRPDNGSMDRQLSVMQIDCEVTRTKLVSYEVAEPLRTQFPTNHLRTQSIAETDKVRKKSPPRGASTTRFSGPN